MDNLQLCSPEFIIKLRMQIEGELREKVERELKEKYEKQLEDQLLVQKEKFREKLEAIKEKLEASGRANAMKLEKLLAVSSEEKKVEKEGVHLVPNEDENLPPILQPKNQHFLQYIVKYLDPVSFTNLALSSKKLQYLTECENVRVPVNLDCVTYSGQYKDSCLQLTYNEKPLSLKRLISLNKKKCFRPSINLLYVKNVKRCGQIVCELLDFVGCATEVEHAWFEKNFDVNDDIFTRFQFGILHLNDISETSFLLCKDLNRTRKLYLRFRDCSNISIVPRFLKKTTIPYVLVFNRMPISVPLDLIKMWCEKRKSIDTIEVFIERGPVDLEHALRSELLKKYADHSVSPYRNAFDLFDLEMETEDIDRLPPAVRVDFGIFRKMYVYRNDMEMLKIDACGDRVSLSREKPKPLQLMIDKKFV